MNASIHEAFVKVYGRRASPDEISFFTALVASGSMKLGILRDVLLWGAAR